MAKKFTRKKKTVSPSPPREPDVVVAETSKEERENEEPVAVDETSKDSHPAESSLPAGKSPVQESQSSSPFEGMSETTLDRLVTIAIKDLNPLQIRRLYNQTLEQQGFSQVEALHHYLLDRSRLRPALMGAFEIAKKMRGIREREKANS